MSGTTNILPATNAGSFGGTGADALPGAPGQTGEQFDLVMANAMAPAAEKNQPPPRPDPNEQDPANFLLSPKTPKSGSQKSATGQTKNAGDQSTSQPNSSDHLQSTDTAIQPENVIPQITLPLVTPMVWSLKSSVETPNVTETAEILTNSTETKNLARPQIKTSDSKNSPGQSVGALTPAVTASTQGKNALAETLSTTDKTESTSPPKPAISAASLSSASSLSPTPVAPGNDKNDVKSFSVSLDSKANSAAPAPSDVNGTSAAKQDTTMKSAEKMSKNASLSGKNLPVSATPALRENNLPVRTDLTATSVSTGPFAASDSVSAATSADGISEMPATVPIYSDSVERIQVLAAIHALRLASTGADSIQVVIKPDTGTQLSLELRQRGNGIEAQAMVQQGDFAHLNQRWPELQQQLEQRGIRLAPLGAENDFNGGSRHGFQHQTTNNSAETDFAGAFAPVALSARSGLSLAQPATVRGWQTWA